MNRTSRIVATLLGLGCLLSATSAHAVPLVFTIDPTLSQLSFNLFTTTGVQFTAPQTANPATAPPTSDQTRISGTLNVDVVTGTSLQFLATGNTQYAYQALQQQPGPAGVFPEGPPGTPAQYGILALIPGVLGGPGPGGTGLIANRGMIGEETSPVIPLLAGAYNSTGVTLNLTAGVSDLNLTILGNPVIGSLPIAGNAAADLLAGGTLVETPLLDTLTLPVRTNVLINAGSGIILVAVQSGVIVATAVPVPEPSSFVMAGFALAGLGLCVARKFRRK